TLAIVLHKAWKIQSEHQLIHIVHLMRDLAYFYCLMLCSGIFLDLILNLLSTTAKTSAILQVSSLVANYDKAIFGKDLLFFLGNLIHTARAGFFSWILVQSYDSIAIALTLCALILFFANKTLARKFIIFFFVITFISAPIWYLLPVMNPLGLDIAQGLGAPSQPRIAAELKAYQPDKILAAYQYEFVQSYQQHAYVNITSFPSMHAGWSVGIIIYLFLLIPESLWLTIPWFILEMLGAVYVGEHYAIDLILGSLIAFAIYYLVEFLFLLEKRYYTGQGSFFLINTLQKDAETLQKSLHGHWKAARELFPS